MVTRTRVCPTQRRGSALGKAQLPNFAKQLLALRVLKGHGFSRATRPQKPTKAPQGPTLPTSEHSVSQPTNCHPEAAESLAKASGSQRRTSREAATEYSPRRKPWEEIREPDKPQRGERTTRKDCSSAFPAPRKSPIPSRMGQTPQPPSRNFFPPHESNTYAPNATYSRPQIHPAGRITLE
jgi:hypothetical protein